MPTFGQHGGLYRDYIELTEYIDIKYSSLRLIPFTKVKAERLRSIPLRNFTEWAPKQGLTCPTCPLVVLISTHLKVSTLIWLTYIAFYVYSMGLLGTRILHNGLSFSLRYVRRRQSLLYSLVAVTLSKTIRNCSRFC